MSEIKVGTRVQIPSLKKEFGRLVKRFRGPLKGIVLVEVETKNADDIFNSDFRELDEMDIRKAPPRK